MRILKYTILQILSIISIQIHAGYNPASIPALPAPRNIVNVSTAAGLITAVSQAKTGQTIMLADGHYYLTSSLRIMTPGITLRGASGDPSKAILHGTGFGTGNTDEELVKIEAANDTLAYFTIRDVRANGLKIQTGGNNNLLVHNVHFIDICERSIKGPDAPVSYNGEIRYCYFEQVTPITSSIPNLNQNGDYIAGMDMMKIDGWKIHDNYFKNIRGMNGGGRAAIFLWNNCSNCIIERNTIVGCDRGIALGNPMNSASKTHVINAICRNNFISSDKYDAAIEIAGVNGAFIVNNSIWKNNESASRGIRFIADFINVELRNNLMRGPLSFDNGQAGLVQSNNVIGSLTGYFVNTATGDLHLTSAAPLALNKGIALTNVSNDWDGQSRATIPDVGADEYSTDNNPPAVMYSLTVTGGTGSGSYKAGANVTITANAAPAGKVFDQWIGSITGLTNKLSASTTLTMPSSNISLTATYKTTAPATYTLTVINGTGSGTYSAGTKVTINANVPVGKSFDKWIGSTGGVTGINSSSTTFTMPAANSTLSATFKNNSVGVDEEKNEVSVYPNPATDNINVELQGSGEVIIEIYDFTGKILKSAKTFTELTQMYVGNLSDGMYILIIKDQENIVSKKFSVTK